MEQQQIGPAPVPQQVQITTARSDQGQQWVVMQIVGPTGTHVAFIDPDAAVEIAKKLTDGAARARTGLILAAAVPS